jgi:putative chitinase
LEDELAIRNRVGAGAENTREDVCVAQAALNENLDRTPGAIRLVVDGAYGRKTAREIARFQAEVMGLDEPDGVFEPGGPAMDALAEGFAGLLNLSVLKGIMPVAQNIKIELYLPHLIENMEKRKIDTPLRRAHFIAQLAHESGGFHYTEELASGAAYEGRKDLGNTRKGDGVRFKGRGLIQLTGRANYRDYGTSIDVNLLDGEAHRTVATDPARAVDAACWFWESRKLNRLADKDDVEAVTRVINGGVNGLADRKAYLARARYFLGA